MHGSLCPLVTYLSYVEKKFRLANVQKLAMCPVIFCTYSAKGNVRSYHTEMVLQSPNPIQPTTQPYAFIFQLRDTENLGMLPSNRFACRYTNKNMQRLGRVVIPSTWYSRIRRPKSTCRTRGGKGRRKSALLSES